MLTLAARRRRNMCGWLLYRSDCNLWNWNTSKQGTCLLPVLRPDSIRDLLAAITKLTGEDAVLA